MDYWNSDGTKLTLGHTFEDGGWYIEIEFFTDCPICLYEIPLHGGEKEFIGGYSSIRLALEAANKLT